MGKLGLSKEPSTISGVGLARKDTLKIIKEKSGKVGNFTVVAGTLLVENDIYGYQGGSDEYEPDYGNFDDYESGPSALNPQLAGILAPSAASKIAQQRVYQV